MIPDEFAQLGGWGVVAWVLWHHLKQVVPLLKSISDRLEGVESAMKNFCGNPDCPLTAQKNTANLPLSKSDKGNPPLDG